MPGAIAQGLHEGTRSEYLAQYVFASWGTAVSIPHQEDHGLDLFCTLTERIGRRAVARSPFTVQVKSTMDPWVFEGEESVRWAVEHPLPLYLCVVDKPSARLSIYHTFPRFYTWMLGNIPDRLELIPAPANGSPGHCTQWTGSHSFSLDQPILDFTINELVQNSEKARSVLKFWIGVENENLTRIRAGLLKSKMPQQYRTNDDWHGGWAENWLTMAEDKQVERAALHLKECLEWMGGQLLQKADLAGAARSALLHRYLFPEDTGGTLGYVHNELNDCLRLKDENYFFAGIDQLGEMVDAALAGPPSPASDPKPTDDAVVPQKTHGPGENRHGT